MTTEKNTVDSPCIGICKYNEHRVCVGCQRTYREVGLWNEFTDEEKRSVLDRIFVNTNSSET